MKCCSFMSVKRSGAGEQDEAAAEHLDLEIGPEYFDFFSWRLAS